MVEVVNEGKFGDALRTTANNVINKYNYYTGKSNSKYNFSRTASSSDIDKTVLKDYANQLKYTGKKDPNAGMLQVQFSATKVPSDMADKVVPDGELYQYVSSYDPSSKIVTMVLPIEGETTKDKVSATADKVAKSKLGSRTKWGANHNTRRRVDKVVGKESIYYDDDLNPLEDDNRIVEDEYESVMTPTPTPYHGKRSHRRKDELEEEVIEETPGLTMSVPEITPQGYLEININGKVYRYEVKDDTHKPADEVASTVSKMQKYSDGKALAYLKKNMQLVKENLSESVDQDIIDEIEGKLRDKIKEVLMSPKFGFEEEDIQDYIRLIIKEVEDAIKVEVRAELSYEGMTRLAEKLDEVIVTYNKYSYFEQVEPGIMEAYIWKDGLKESVNTENIEEDKKVSFKDHHICQGCGNPLSKCTCSIEEDFSGATQPSSVGQHKVCSDDIEEGECK